MNNKGFMMAEVVVVSAIILIALTAFYVNYNRVITLYNERLSYYDPTLLYKLAKYRDDNYLTTDFGSVGSTGLKSKTTDGIEIFWLRADNLSKLRNNVENISYQKYVDYLKEKLKGNKNYILVTEKCDSNKMNCKYAYLEVMVK